MRTRLLSFWLPLAAAFFLGTSLASAVTIDWVTVGGAGNAAFLGTVGAVSYEYQIGKLEVSNAQYTEFLNAVADTDTYGLYNTNMGNPNQVPLGYGGITRTGSSGSFSYSAIAGRENMPVNWVTFWDSLRFANWLHNGQPTGAQGNGTTEGGSYTLGGYTGSDGSWIGRNPGATIFLTSEDEWYKAAYYDVGSASYFSYATATGAPMTCTAPGATANTANCGNVLGDFADVGSYTGTASPNGTFDQGGNLWEWNEGLTGSNRNYRGGDFSSHVSNVTAGVWGNWGPSTDSVARGFRVATVIPEPSTALLLAGGLLGLAGSRRGRPPGSRPL